MLMFDTRERARRCARLVTLYCAPRCALALASVVALCFSAFDDAEAQDETAGAGGGTMSCPPPPPATSSFRNRIGAGYTVSETRSWNECADLAYFDVSARKEEAITIDTECGAVQFGPIEGGPPAPPSVDMSFGGVRDDDYGVSETWLYDSTAGWHMHSFWGYRSIVERSPDGGIEPAAIYSGSYSHVRAYAVHERGESFMGRWLDMSASERQTPPANGLNGYQSFSCMLDLEWQLDQGGQEQKNGREEVSESYDGTDPFSGASSVGGSYLMRNWTDGAISSSEHGSSDSQSGFDAAANRWWFSARAHRMIESFAPTYLPSSRLDRMDSRATAPTRNGPLTPTHDETIVEIDVGSANPQLFRRETTYKDGAVESLRAEDEGGVLLDMQWKWVNGVHQLDSASYMGGASSTLCSDVEPWVQNVSGRETTRCLFAAPEHYHSSPCDPGQLL